jgi:hypothetical protein
MSLALLFALLVCLSSLRLDFHRAEDDRAIHSKRRTLVKDAFKVSGSSPQSDFTLDSHGSICLLHPHTNSARIWVHDNIGKDNGFQPYWPTVVIEPRYVEQIVEGITVDGLLIGGGQ